MIMDDYRITSAAEHHGRQVKVIRSNDKVSKYARGRDAQIDFEVGARWAFSQLGQAVIEYIGNTGLDNKVDSDL